MPATYTWSAAADGAASVPGNWLVNGAPAPNAPGANDSLVFNNTSLKTCTVDIAKADVISVNFPYTGTLKLQNSLEVTSTFFMSSGTLDGDGRGLTIPGGTAMLKSEFTAQAPNILYTTVTLGSTSNRNVEGELAATSFSGSRLFNYGSLKVLADIDIDASNTGPSTITNYAGGQLELVNGIKFGSPTAKASEGTIRNEGEASFKGVVLSTDFLNAGSEAIARFEGSNSMRFKAQQSGGTFELRNCTLTLQNATSGPLEIFNGRITGIGTIDGNLILGSDATSAQPIIEPGLGATFGDITITKSLDMLAPNGRTKNKVGAGGTSTKIIVQGGPAKVKGFHDLTVTTTEAPAIAEHVLIDVQNAQGVQGTFSNRAEGDAFDFNSKKFKFTYKGNKATTGNDFSIYPVAKVNARVWDDTNIDGLMVGEPGLANVPVQLYRVTAAYPDGQLVAETTTDAAGDYLFDDLAAGDYYVVSGKPDPDWWKFTRKDLGQSGSNDIDNDSDADRETDPHPGRTHTFTLDPGEVETWVDIGQYKLGSVGNWVWNDYRIGGDGIQNNNYGGYTGLDVTLFSTPSGYGAATTTGYDGYYLLEKVELVDANWLPITYQVQFTKPPNGAYLYAFAPQDQGGDDALDSDADPTTGLTGPFTLPGSGAVNLTIDCGIQVEQVSSGGGSFAAPDLGGGYPDALIGVAGQMWVDEDRDGVRDPGELPVPGWRVRLFTAAGALAAETWTGWDGTYRFADVADGSYRVRFDPPVGGVGFTRRDRGNDDTRDSDADADGYTTLFTYVGTGPGVAHLDAGLVPPGGRVRGAPLSAGPSASPQWVGIDPFGLWGDDKDDDPAAVIAAIAG